MSLGSESKIVAFQGAHGAYSDIAAMAALPNCQTLPCSSFEDVFAAVNEGRADLGMIPVENSVAGRVADIHYLLPKGNLSIIGEHYQPIVHHLLGVPGAKLNDITEAHSHVQALSQCREWLRGHNINPMIKGDTASSVANVAEAGEKHIAAIGSELAGKLYGLDSIAVDIADLSHNTTRFLILSPEAKNSEVGSGACMTTMLFRVRSVPAALYKALGGFATNGVNITKLESYLVDGNFTAAQFYIDVEGHPEETPLKLALEELKFFADKVDILGTYPAASFRKQTKD